jgi:dihydrofolate reductase
MSRRKIMMFNRVTPEGHFAAGDGAQDWFVPDGDLDTRGAEGLSGTGMFLFGRHTYEMFASFWPHALSKSTTSPHGGGPLAPEQQRMAVTLNELPKLVFSRTLKAVTWSNSRLVRELDPAAIEAMKSEPGKDIVVLGSGSLVAQLSQHGLIDEYQLVVTPVFLGEGRPLLGGLTKRLKLELLEAKAYRSGNVLLRYARRN